MPQYSRAGPVPSFVPVLLGHRKLSGYTTWSYHLAQLKPALLEREVHMIIV